jgi:hypothetical protein
MLAGGRWEMSYSAIMYTTVLSASYLLWRSNQGLFAVGGMGQVEPSVAQLVERLTVVFDTVFQYLRKSIGRWFDSGHSEIISSTIIFGSPYFHHIFPHLHIRLCVTAS